MVWVGCLDGVGRLLAGVVRLSGLCRVSAGSLDGVGRMSGGCGEMV